jgi:hypothetical protein
MDHRNSDIATMTDTKKMEIFRNRADRLIQIAERVHDHYVATFEVALAAQVELLIANVKVICEGVESGRLLPSEGVGFGLSRAVGEWAEDADLVDAAYDLETFYREEL